MTNRMFVLTAIYSRPRLWDDRMVGSLMLRELVDTADEWAHIWRAAYR